MVSICASTHNKIVFYSYLQNCLRDINVLCSNIHCIWTTFKNHILGSPLQGQWSRSKVVHKVTNMSAPLVLNAFIDDYKTGSKINLIKLHHLVKTTCFIHIPCAPLPRSKPRVILPVHSVSPKPLEAYSWNFGKMVTSSRWHAEKLPEFQKIRFSAKLSRKHLKDLWKFPKLFISLRQHAEPTFQVHFSCMIPGKTMSCFRQILYLCCLSWNVYGVKLMKKRRNRNKNLETFLYL